MKVPSNSNLKNAQFPQQRTAFRSEGPHARQRHLTRDYISVLCVFNLRSNMKNFGYLHQA
jgi:hypothetical protein